MLKNCVIYFHIIYLLLLPVAGFTQLVKDSQQVTARIEEGSSITLTANAPDANFFQWFRDGNIIQGGNQKKYMATLPGSYTVISFNNINCTSDVSDPVNVIVVPKANTNAIANLNISKSADNKPALVNDDFMYTITVTNAGPDDASEIVVKDTLSAHLEMKEMPLVTGVKSSYHAQSRTAIWEIGSLKKDEKIDLKILTKALYPGEINNTAYVTASESDPDNSDNSATEIKHIYGIKIPNVFTPNNDGLNETFNIAGLDAYPDNEITILNRWGNHVYEKKPYINDWTGQSLNEGTYFYVLKIKTEENKWEVFKGFITLLRNKR